jgi:hypothetical protein
MQGRLPGRIGLPGMAGEVIPLRVIG